MQLTILSPRKSLNKAYLKVKPSRSDIELFKKNLIGLLDGLDKTESEEHVKNDLSDFLKNTFYQKFYINTKERTDLVIHNGTEAKSLAGVLIEAKKPSNKTEMVRSDSLNSKAFHELILYYLRERIINHNIEIKHLVVTNIFEWYVFDAILFEKTFAQDKKLVQQFTDFEEGRLASESTDFFYKEIAEPFIAGLTSEFCFTWFDFREYDKPLRNEDKKDDSKLISLYKLLSPEHLLKLPFTNDSNSLDKAFYSELLHIIGLTEIKEGSKKLIGRKKEGDRNSGSLIESAILQLDNLDKISRLEKPAQFGATAQERLFNAALELSITWINRILFLKLLEAQMIKYHKGDISFAFLNCEKVQSFDDLNSLFFSVLARKLDDRNEAVRKIFANVPYLNSSLFEPTDIEHSCLFISQLKDDKLAIIASTVLKDNNGKKFKGELYTLEYLFKFLDAYDFAGEGSEEIQEENKTLINASVLGLIFEKINGYKGGSFFTPGFITMYMCHETIRRAVIQKFNEVKGWNCEDINNLYNKIEDIQEANLIVNSLKICDPAVGSGHFLVSALNEIIAIKSELKILLDKEGKRLKEYHVEVVNDELIITDEDGELFEYNPKSPESQRAQEAIFHEKHTIIENCLFGVDINPNSVKICRLRLWIELLKNAYYLTPQPPLPRGEGELETLPNIDINIKCGNSLISRYSLDADIKQALKKSKWNIDSYRLAVMTYRNAGSKEEKREMENLIGKIKKDFQSEISQSDPKIKKRDKLVNDLYHRFTGHFLFEPEESYGGKDQERKRKKEQKKIEDEITKLNREIEGIKENTIYENAFEWRFEFPEVLNDEGDFVGFDVVIGNPPYGVSIKKGQERELLLIDLGKVPDFEIFYWFINKGNLILAKSGQFSYIIPNTILFNLFAQNYRIELFKKWHFEEILDCTNFVVFDDATVRNIILMLRKEENGINITYRNTNDISQFSDLILRPKLVLTKEYVATNNQNWGLLFKLNSETLSVISRIRQNSNPLTDLFPETSQGLIAYDKYQGQSEETIKNRIFHSFEKKLHFEKLWIYGEDVTKYSIKWNGKEYINYCEGIANPRDPKYFIGKRILIREITNPSIFAAITSDELYNDPSIIIIKDNMKQDQISIDCLLAILNSKLATFYHFNSSPKATKGAFPKILVNDVNVFPIPKCIKPENELKIVNLVNQLLKLIDNTIKEETTIKVIEDEINQFVYELYCLTEEEIKIVENS